MLHHNLVKKQRLFLAKKMILPGLLLTLLLCGCKKEKDPDYAQLILGTWVNTHVDNKAVLTDSSFAFEFTADFKQHFAMGYTLDENNRTWITNENYSYTIDGTKITIDGTNKLSSVFHMEFNILSLDQNMLTYSVSKFIVDNVEYPDTKIYTNKKVTIDYSTQFTGTWYGRTTTPGAKDTAHHYWSYQSDGHFSYYYQDSQGHWINKSDNEGGYFLYGDLLASNYTNDLISGETGKAYECWNISIQGNTMYWTGLRENGVTTSFRMEKVPGPPVNSSTLKNSLN